MEDRRKYQCNKCNLKSVNPTKCDCCGHLIGTPVIKAEKPLVLWARVKQQTNYMQ